MPNTWKFTRRSSMLFKYIETFFYALISNTDYIIYFAMMGSMYQSAGFISMLFPILIFGYSLIEETRPRAAFWSMVRVYTMVLLTIKFTFNLTMFEEISSSKSFKYYSELYKIGLRKENDSISSIFKYLCSEILIITFIMLNQVALKL